jgi:hypothetical protein
MTIADTFGRKPMRSTLRYLTLLLLGGGLAWAQSTQPADPALSWEQTVQMLADALVAPDEREELSLVLPAGTAIRRFDRMDPEDRLSLRSITAGSVLIGAFAYRSTPTTMASDLIGSLQDAEFIPDTVRDEFAVGGDKEIRQANETASIWVSTTLQPGVEQPVGVLVLWQVKAPQSPSEQAEGQLIFVLVKAHAEPTGRFRISQLMYGDTRHIIR